MAMTDLSPRTATDLQGLQRLKQTARSETGQNQALQESSRQFEALFLQMMLKSMRDATPKSGLLESSQSNLYSEMLDQQWSQQLAGQGVGLSQQLVQQLQQQVAHNQPAKRTTDGTATDTVAGIQRSVPRPLYGGLSADAVRTLATLETQRNVVVGAARVVSPFRAGMRAYTESVSASSTAYSDTSRPAYMRNFVQQFTAPARAASAVSGVPAELILAQAALETGWGRQEIPTGNGGNSHNLFGIKANGTWKGATVDALTTEFVNGQVQETVESFRAYPSYHAAFVDYARLISNNPRYAGVVSASTPAQAAQALQRGGYATDPDYAEKLISIMKNIGSLSGGSVMLARGESSGR